MNEIYTKHDERIKLEFFKLLFDYGADVNACSKEGMTVLMMTIEQVCFGIWKQKSMVTQLVHPLPERIKVYEMRR